MHNPDCGLHACRHDFKYADAYIGAGFDESIAVENPHACINKTDFRVR